MILLNNNPVDQFCPRLNPRHCYLFQAHLGEQPQTRRLPYVSGWALAFINSFDEVTMTVFMAAPGKETLPDRMFLYIQGNINPLVTTVFACVILVTVLALVALDRIYGLKALLIGRGQGRS
jgi:hypothetical protein